MEEIIEKHLKNMKEDLIDSGYALGTLGVLYYDAYDELVLNCTYYLDELE